MDWFRSRHDLDDERVLIGFTGGVLWLVGSLAGALGQLLPGAPHVDAALFVVLACGVFLYGLVSISGWIDWSKVSVAQHALASATLMPLLGVVLWATGGQDSYLQPILVLPLLHVAYFFRPAVSLPLVAELIAVYASPLLYEDQLLSGFPARLLAFAMAAVVLTAVLRLLKEGLVAAEERQRRIALHDPLTGLVNRRGFDDALRAAVAASGDPAQGRRESDAHSGFALIIFDLDSFKRVNDTFGHPAGDRLLRAIAAACSSQVRPLDTLARIGGDEFAVIAPGAGEAGAQRLAEALTRAVEGVGAKVTVAWAVRPGDGSDSDTLLRIADRRLYTGKAAKASGNAPVS